ncbi:Cytochrome c domain-containing protein [Aphelenchoides besseyi]|nr:Cytochrome c domain-containing protein [Aphelenchoides besseyi]
MSTPEGDYEKRKNFKDLCSKCHDVFSNAKMTGPTLNGVVGRLGGQIRKFKCSSAMMKKSVTWTQETLFEYLRDPKK